MKPQFEKPRARMRIVEALTAISIVLILFNACAGNAPSEAELTEDASANQKLDIPYKSENWPSFRGLHASGLSENQDLPVTWNVETGGNIRWKTPIPGLGHSSPVVWGNRVFVTTAVGEGHEASLKVGRYGESPDNPEDYTHHYRLYCIDRDTGSIMWEKTAYSGKPKVQRHVKSSHSNCAPATDGENVIAFFGSQGLYCYDMEGNLKWEKDLGYLDAGAFDYPEIQWGFGSSPIIYQDKVIVLCDVNNQSFLTVLDVQTGNEIWKTLRDETPTWGTPAVHESENLTQVIVNGYKHLGSYDLATGKEIWWKRGGGDIPVPTPVMAHGLVFFTSAHGKLRPIFAVKLSAQGDISLEGGEESNEFIPWYYPRRGAYMPTPLVYGDLLYSNNNSGLLTCFKATTGEILYREKLGGDLSSYSASPVAADGKIYFTDEYGNVHVVQAGPEYQHLATNQMGEICMATPAISAKTLFVRARRHLFAISKEAM